MPSDVSGVLQTKIAGVPVWVAGLVIVGGVLVVRQLGIFPGFGQNSPSGVATTPNQGIPSGFVPASEVGISAPSPSPATASQPFLGMIGPQPAGYNAPGVQYFSSAAPTNTLGYIPWGASFNITGPPVQGAAQLDHPGGSASTTWYPISFQGQTGWLNQIAIGSYSGTPPVGQGGAGAGSKTAVLMHHGHPLLKQRIRFPHYVVAGRGGASSSVHGVAHAAGVHPARLMALNQHLRAQGYRAQPGQIIRVA